MHFHLINFQIVEQWNLKYALDPVTSPVTCTYYELDYYGRIGIYTSSKQNITAPIVTNFDKCLFLKTVFDITKEEDIYQQYLENQPNPGTNIYGLNVFEKIGPSDVGKYNDPTCPVNSTYKYLCQQTPIVEWYTKWKEVAFVYPGQVQRLRIRWASNDYNPTVKAYPYFSIPEDHLIEFPGYVYHCHFLTHEDD